MGASEAIAGATERAARAERECDELRTEVARVHADWRGAVGALALYGQHRPGCVALTERHTPCECGFIDALAAIGGQ